MKLNYSIIIPHYNSPQSLEKLLSTIPTRSDLQVMVIDDCSTEFIEELENLKLKFPNVEWYSTGINGGGGKARNVGLKNAKGKYLIFADADDIINPNFNEILEDYKDTNYDLVYFNNDSRSNDEKIKIHSIGSYKEISRILRNRNPINKIKYKYKHPWAKFFSATIISENKIEFQETRVGNDAWFSTLNDYYSQNNVIDTRSFYTYLIHSGSVSRKCNPQKELDALKVFKTHWDFFKTKGIKKSKYSHFKNNIGLILITNDSRIINTAKTLYQEIGISNFEFYLIGKSFIMQRKIKKLINYLYFLILRKH